MNEHKTQQMVVLLMLSLAIGMCGVVVALQWVDTPAALRAIPHTQFPDTLLQRDLHPTSDSTGRWLALTFGLLEIGLFLSFLLLSVRCTRAQWVWLSLIGVLHGAVFVAMFVADFYYASGQLRLIVLGFPLPTALMIYGVGGIPLLFAVLYFLRFESMVLTPKDLRQVERIVLERSLPAEERSS